MKQTNYFQILLFATILITFFGCNSKVKEGKFLFTEFTNEGPIGIIKMDEILGKDYHEIIKVSDTLYVDKTYNGKGVLTNTKKYFINDNGTVRETREINEYGFVYQTHKYNKLPNNENSLIDKSSLWGRNDFAPCNAILKKFKDGLVIEETCLDKQGNKMKDNKEVVIYKIEYFDNDLIKSISFYDKDNAPIKSTDGYHIKKYERNDKGCLTKITYFDENNKPCSSKEGYHQENITTNNNCSITSVSYYAVDGAKIPDAYGVHKYSYQVANGLVLKETRLDTELKPTVKDTDGVHIVRNQFDEKGNVISKSFFNINNTKINNNSGIQTIKYSYKDGKGLETKYFLNSLGKPTSDNSDIHKYFYVRDDKGLVAYESFFGKNGQPIKDDINRVYMVKYERDLLGRIVASSYWKTGNTAMNRWSGIHRYEYKYNNVGLQTEQHSFDKYGYLTQENFGSSQTISTYDSLDRLASVSYWNGEEPTFVKGRLCVAGYHKRTFTYSDNGQQKEIKYFGTYENPVNIKICEVDTYAHRVEIIYKGNQVFEQRFYKVGADFPTKVQNCKEKECLTLYGNSTKKFNY